MPSARRGRLVLLCGIAGSGKTTIALAIGARLERCVHIETDVVRGTIARPQHTTGESRFVYRSAFSQAAEALKQRYDVVLVATFPREELRREAISRLGNLCDAWLMVWAWCDPVLAYLRYSRRNPMVRREDFMRLSRAFEPPRDALMIDSRSTSPEEAATKILNVIGEKAS